MKTLTKLNRWFDAKSLPFRFLVSFFVLLSLAFIGGVISRLTHSQFGLGVYFIVVAGIIFLRRRCV